MATANTAAGTPDGTVMSMMMITRVMIKLMTLVMVKVMEMMISDGNPCRWHPQWHGGADDDDDNDDESDGNPYSIHGIGGVEVDADERN